MEEQDKIVVYERFQNGIEANLAKTKLDAYGIPCFLSEENFGNIFPFKGELFGGVRLHIFEKDKAAVAEILASP